MEPLCKLQTFPHQRLSLLRESGSWEKFSNILFHLDNAIADEKYLFVDIGQFDNKLQFATVDGTKVARNISFKIIKCWVEIGLAWRITDWPLYASWSPPPGRSCPPCLVALAEPPLKGRGVTNSFFVNKNLNFLGQIGWHSFRCLSDFAKIGKWAEDQKFLRLWLGFECCSCWFSLLMEFYKIVNFLSLCLW